jgi:arylsulfatase A-like enzyme
MRPPVRPRALALAALLAVSCSRGARRAADQDAPAAPPPSASAVATAAPAPPGLNVLFITVDSLRADMPWTGYPRPIAPALTRFAESAVVYSRFYALSSYTAMSLGGLLAGRYPSELARDGYYFVGWDEGVTFFPQLLQRAGVRTVGAHAHFYFDRRSGFRRGFDAWAMVPGIGDDHQTDENVTGPAQLELATSLLSDEATTRGRFFAWFHFMDPHDEYREHEGIDWGPTPRDRYDGEVTFTDRQLGKLLDFVAAQPWGARTAVVVSADHGELFGEHGRQRHGFELWDELVHVPLLVRVPGVAPRRIDTPRSALDLAPTILELAGVAADPAMEGTSLVPELRGASVAARDVVLDLPRTSNSDRRRALVRGPLKLYAFGDDEAFQLFDLERDPREERNAAWTRRAELEELRRAYEALDRKILHVCPAPGVKLTGKKPRRPC